MHRPPAAGPRLATATVIAACVVLTGCASTNQRNATPSVQGLDGMVSDEAASAGGGPAGTQSATGSANGDSSPTGSASGAATGGDSTATAGVDGTSGARGGADATTTDAGEGTQPSTGAGAGAGSTGPSTPGSGATSSPSNDVAMGPGVTADTITLGFQWAEDLQAGFAIVGASGDPADEEAMSVALVNWLNANGGIRGRRVEAVSHGTNAANGSWAAQAQAACATFTEDNTSFAVVSSAVGGDDSLLACLAEKDTPLVETNLWLFDRQYYHEYPDLLYRPGNMVADVWVRALVDGLAKIGYFEGATVGLLRFDAPVFDRLADNVMLPALAEYGIHPEVAEIGSPNSVADFGSSGSQMANAVVRFRAAGVTHVLMLENAGIMPFLFMQEAEAQGYRPVYGLSSADIPTTQAGQQEPAQLAGAVGIGWTPPNDVPHGDNPGGNPHYDTCRQILSDAGLTNLTGFYAQSRCDAVFFLKAAMEAAPDLTRAGLAAGVAGMGDSYLSPFTMGSSFGPGKPDGADVVRPFAFVDECACFRYTHSPYAIR